MRKNFRCEGMSVWPRYFIFHEGVLMDGPFPSYWRAERDCDGPAYNFLRWRRPRGYIRVKSGKYWPEFERARLIDGVEIRSER